MFPVRSIKKLRSGGRDRIVASGIGPRANPAALVFHRQRCETFAMNFRFHRYSAWLWVLCVVLLAVRVSDAHWHLCHDGNEPPQTVHLWDSSVDDRTEPGHTDTNLSLVDDGLSKTLDQSIELPALLAIVALFCVLLLPRRGVRIAYRAPFFPAVPQPRSAQPRAPPR
jgi:hypothetical protein